MIRSIEFLREVISRRLEHFFGKENGVEFGFPEVNIEPGGGALNHFLLKYQPNLEEYTIFLLALMPHLQPNFIDTIVQGYLPNGGNFAEIGGAKVNNHRGMLPTGETALFILAGNDLQSRLRVVN
ncbi:MAG TPA: hypothetical protein VNS32_04035, partial [Flavisolibacter sp.]|nr:hypothetical protein [Flavisolibacter sp.]